MSIFQNSFFSVAGQVERLKNVGATLVAAVTGKVKSNTGNRAVDTALSTAASHPFAVAGIAAVAAAPAAAGAAAKAVVSSAATSFASAGLGTKAVVLGGGIVGTSALLNSPKLATEVIQTPSSLANFGANIGKAVETPSLNSITNVVKENPGVSAALAGVAALAAGAGTVGLASTLANTSAIKENTKVATAAMQGSSQLMYRDASGAMIAASPDWTEDIAKEQLKIQKEQAQKAAELAQDQLKAETKIKEQELAAQKEIALEQIKAQPATAQLQPAAVEKITPKATKKPAKKKPASRPAPTRKKPARKKPARKKPASRPAPARKKPARRTTTVKKKKARK